MNIFEVMDYRKALRDGLLLKKQQIGKPYTFQAMANACRVQKAYLSKVLGGDGHLSEDQLYLAATFLRLSDGERRYMMVLHMYERSTVTERRRTLLAELERVRAEHLKTENVLKATPMAGNEQDVNEYYLDPNLQIVHMFLSIPRYAREPDRIGRELALGKLQLAELLERLLKLGLVTYQDGQYRVEKNELHLRAGSPVFHAYRALMRFKALDQLAKLGSDDAYSFSVVFSADDVTRAAVKARILDMIRSSEGLVQKAPREEVYQMTIDLFRWSQGAR
jgi:uncharacterized protein (TIGR02147 family)